MLWGKKRLKPFGAIAVILALGVVGCSKGVTQGARDKIPVKVVTVSKGRVETTVEAAGSLLPYRSANVTAKVAGEVSAVHADVGEEVKAGQLLVELDLKELKAQLKQAEAGVEQVKEQAEQAKISIETAKLNEEIARLNAETAKAELDNMEKSYNRVKALVEAGAAPQSQLDDLETKLSQARKRYEIAQKQYDLAVKQQEAAEKQYAIATGPGLAQAEAAKNVLEVQMSNGQIFSPLTGIVTNRYINPGEIAAPGVALLSIAETSFLKLLVTVPQETVSYLALGQKVSVLVDAFPGKEFNGEIDKIGPLSVSQGQRFPVEIKVANPGELKPGMTARVLFHLKGEEGLIVPASALQREAGVIFVFVIDAQGVAHRRVVTLGLGNEEKVTVLKGLSEGEQVAVTNVTALQEGMAVTLDGLD